MNPDLPDRITTSLVRAVVAGEEIAWRRLVRLYSPSLERFMTRCRIPESDRDSLKNDVFGEAFKAMNGFVGQNGSRSFLKWLWVIARRRVTRFMEHERRRLDRASGGSSSGVVTTIPDMPVEPTDDERAELLKDVLNSLDLSDDDSRLLKQYFMERRTAVQIGEESGMTDAAVRQRVARLLKRIREQTEGLEGW
ncbi:MAG: sigma-70 family RNA polymerase sigma factor [Planctomycetales bacterium]